MIEIRMNGEALDLPSGFAIEIEDSSPIFNDTGSQSVPATVPATRRNTRLLNAPHRLDAGADPNSPERAAEVVDGAYIRRGVMNVTEAGRKEGITFNVGFDNSTAYVKWQQKKLSEIAGSLTFTPPKGRGVQNCLQYLYRLYTSANPVQDSFAVFPLAVNNESTGSDMEKRTYWEVLNIVDTGGLSLPDTVTRLIDGEVTEVTVPSGYMVTPFLRVWRIIEMIFADLDLEIERNPFRADRELARLVVLNNAADAVCRGVIKYSDLMPDSTVEEFLNALWVRFGLVYNIDERAGRVTLRFLKDIINERGGRSLDGYVAGPAKIIYNERQYIKLSAKTSIEGAAPSHERFEDFARGIDVSKVSLGNHVSQWTNTGTQDEPEWDGDVMGGYYDDYDPEPDYPDPESPDPDGDRDDGRDDYDGSRSAQGERADASVESSGRNFLAREFITGTWHRLDASNNKVRLSSSSFFNWDPQPEGLTAFELSSDDEFVPIQRVSILSSVVGASFNELCPLYLFGARHYHSYIKGSDESENSGDRTPLAFMFAYTRNSKTVGRLTGEGEDGLVMTLDDGTKPTLSLLFQFKDGLFARFWADYDEILRHGNRSVEVDAGINKIDLTQIPFLSPCTLNGIRVLVDTMSYSLPAGREINTTLKLRTIQTHGDYDIRKEQNVPDFSAVARHLEWILYSDTYGDVQDSPAVREAAVLKFKQDTGYQPHGQEGDYWNVGAAGIEFKSKSRAALTWQTDTSRPSPVVANNRYVGIYKALLTYAVYEVHDMSLQDGPDDWELSETPIGEVSVGVDYEVELRTRWVND